MLTSTWETESLCPRLSFMPGKLKRIVTVPSLRELSFLLERQDILQRNKAAGNSEKSSVLGARLLGFYCQLCRLLTASSWASTLVILRFSSKNYIIFSNENSPREHLFSLPLSFFLVVVNCEVKYELNNVVRTRRDDWHAWELGMTKCSPHISCIWRTIQNTTIIALEQFIEHLLFYRLYTLHRISLIGVWLWI